jgi:hypothetical protein
MSKQLSFINKTYIFKIDLLSVLNYHFQNFV